MTLAFVSGLAEASAAFPVGLALGLAVVAPPGPVSLAVVGVAAHQGRRRALHAALGVAAADVVWTIVALGLSSRIGTIGHTAMALIRVALGLLLGGAAIAALRRPDAASLAIADMQRPGRTLAAIALANPMALAGWLGLAAAIDGRFHGAAMVAVGVGLIVASIGWHLVLVTVARQTLGSLSAAGRRRFTIGSAAFLCVLAATLVASGVRG